MTRLNPLVLATLTACLASGCVIHLKALEPKPNVIYAASAQKKHLALKLDDSIHNTVPVAVQGGTIQFDNLRDDLTTAFTNGFSPYFALDGEPEVVLALTNAEPSFECYPYVGCKAQIKFRGVIANGADAATTPFGGRAESDIIPMGQDTTRNAAREAIERMYEEISTAMGAEKALDKKRPASATST